MRFLRTFWFTREFSLVLGCQGLQAHALTEKLTHENIKETLQLLGVYYQMLLVKDSPFYRSLNLLFLAILCKSLEIKTQKVSGSLWLKCMEKAEIMSRVNLWNSGFNATRISIVVHISGANFTAWRRYRNPLTTLMKVELPCKYWGSKNKK